MNKCPKCGKESDSDICPDCGCEMISCDDSSSGEKNDAKDNKKIDKSKSDKKSKFIPVIICFGGFVLLVLILVMTGLFSVPDDHSTDYEKCTEPEVVITKDNVGNVIYDKNNIVIKSHFLQKVKDELKFEITVDNSSKDYYYIYLATNENYGNTAKNENSIEIESNTSKELEEFTLSGLSADVYKGVMHIESNNGEPVASIPITIELKDLEDYKDYIVNSNIPQSNNSTTNQEANKSAPKYPADELIVDTDGKKIYKVYCTTGRLHFTGSFSGQGNFIVQVLNSNQDLQELVVNEIGDYVVDKTVYVGTGYHYIQIECSRGSWTMKWEGTGTTYQ